MERMNVWPEKFQTMQNYRFRPSLYIQEPSVHQAAGELYFLRLGLPSTLLIRHGNGAFRKRSSNQRNLKTLAFCFRVICLTEFFSNKNSKWAVIVAFFSSSGLVWTENIWCVYRAKSPFSNSFSIWRTLPENKFAGCGKTFGLSFLP